MNFISWRGRGGGNSDQFRRLRRPQNCHKQAIASFEKCAFSNSDVPNRIVATFNEVLGGGGNRFEQEIFPFGKRGLLFLPSAMFRNKDGAIAVA